MGMAALERTRKNGNGPSPYATRELVNPLFDTAERHEDNINELFGKTNELIAGRGKTNWQTLIAGLSLAVVIIGAMWALGLTPVKTSIDDVKATIAQKDRQDERQYDRIRALEALTIQQGERIAAAQKTIDTFRDLIRRLENESVASKDYAKDSLVLQKQLDSLHAKYDSVFPPAKTFEEFATRLRNLEGRTFESALPKR